MIRQYWRPHWVVTCSTTKTTRTQTAVITHARAIHHNESGTACPQSMDGLNDCRAGHEVSSRSEAFRTTPHRKACRGSYRRLADRLPE